MSVGLGGVGGGDGSALLGERQLADSLAQALSGRPPGNCSQGGDEQRRSAAPRRSERRGSRGSLTDADGHCAIRRYDQHRASRSCASEFRGLSKSCDHSHGARELARMIPPNTRIWIVAGESAASLKLIATCELDVRRRPNRSIPFVILLLRVTAKTPSP